MKDTVEEIVADIAAAAPGTKFPADVLERITALNDGPHANHARDLGMILWGAGASFVEWAVENGYDREAAMRIVAQKLEAGAAMFIRRLYANLGRPFSPGRFAIVAYTMAEHADKTITDADIERADAALAEFMAEETAAKQDAV